MLYWGHISVKKCKFKVLENIKKPEDIPLSIPEGLEKEFYQEFYMRCIKIFHAHGMKERADLCEKKLKELGELFS